nr:helix-turn-helix transcriptional regulator [Streptomyces sp. YIM 98790]
MVRLRQLRRAKDLMDRDWSQPLDVDAVAAHAGYSPYHFVRAFKSAYGESPGQYLSRRRIERAEELLRTAGLSVTEICHLVGFHSLGSFSCTFKRRTGLTPGEYRKRHLHRGAALIPGCFALLWNGGFPARAPAGAPAAQERNSGEAHGPAPAYGEDRSVTDSDARGGRTP